MRITAGCLGFLAVLASAPRAWAGDDAPLELSVERAPGSESCPDENELRARIEQIRGRRSAATTPYHVTFAHDSASLTATIRSGNDASNARVLKTEEATCNGLAQAVAVTLALLIDSAAPSAAPAPTPKPPSPAAPPPPRATEKAPPAARQRREIAGTLAVGATALIGVVRPIAPVFNLELGARVSAFRASVGAAWMVPQDLELAPGSVHERFVAGTARLCLAALRSNAWRFDLCSGAWLALRSAEGRGYSQNSLHHSTWLGVPLELSLARLSAPWGWEVSAGALLSVPRRQYTIAGVGTAYEAPALGFVLSARAFLGWPW